MVTAPMHPEEKKRLDILYSKNILDTESDPRFDEITNLAAKEFNVPISTISILDENREWFKSCVGLDIKEGARDVSFCGHALVENDILICEDTLEDERFSDNPYVIGEPFIRFYAGMKLLDKNSGMPMGVFCIKDKKPRKLSLVEMGKFLELAAKVETLIQ